MMPYTSALLNDSSEPVRARTAMMHFRPAVFGVLTRPGPLACAWAWCDTAPTVVPHPVAGNARYANKYMPLGMTPPGGEASGASPEPERDARSRQQPSSPATIF